MSESYSPEDIVQLYGDKSVNEIEIITGIPKYRIYQILAELEERGSVAIRPQGRLEVLVSPGKEYLLSLQKHGFTQFEMAEYLHVSKRTVQRWLEEE